MGSFFKAMLISRTLSNYRSYCCDLAFSCIQDILKVFHCGT
uniref:Uncharacterized protein n=1 Tax=Anguilla anguilla TaxID=7936 RepID=A0A0E9XKI1_ANGAN